MTISPELAGRTFEPMVETQLLVMIQATRWANLTTAKRRELNARFALS